MGGGQSSPDTPSASETGAQNRKTAQYNTEMSFVDQYSPQGSYVYSKIQDANGDQAPRYRLDVNLSPAEQAKYEGMNNIQQGLLDLGNGQIGRVSDAVSSPFDWSSIPTVQGRDDATQNAMKYLTYGMDDRYANQQATLENQLAAQGIRPGSTAYTQAMKDYNTDKNTAYERAGLQAYNTGLQEQANSAQLRQQAIQEEAYKRSLPLNELTSLISGTQVNMPSFTPIQTAQAAQQPYYNNASGNNWSSDLLGLGGSLGSSAILGAFMS